MVRTAFNRAPGTYSILVTALTLALTAISVNGAGPTPQANAAAIVKPADTSSPITIAVIGDYGCDTTASTCAATNSYSSAVASLVHSWNPTAIWTVGDNSYQWGCVGSAGFTQATNHNCAYPDPSLTSQATGTVGSGSTNTALVASATSPTPADRWANDWYNNETITVVDRNGADHTGTVGNNVEPTPYHLFLKSGFQNGYVPQLGDTFTIAALDDVDADQSPYAADIAAGRFYAVPGNHDATNMNNVVFGGSAANAGAYCPHQNDGSGYYSGNLNCGYLFNRPSHYTAGFGSDGQGHNLVDFFALDTRGTDPDGFGPNSRQYADYENDLFNSTAVWKIEAQHEPNWSSGEFGPYAASGKSVFGSQNTNWTIDGRIDLFLSGHDHDMEQIYGYNATNTGPGKTFMVMGSGGKSADPFTKPPCPFQGIAGVNDCYSASGYPYTVWRGDDSSTFGANSEQLGALKLTISALQLKAQYIAVDGTVLHSYSLYKGGVAAPVGGTISDASTTSPIVGAKVSYDDGDVYTGAAGSAYGAGGYDFPDGIPDGATLTVSAPGYQTATVQSVPSTPVNLALRPQTALFADSFESGDLSQWESPSAVPPTACGPATTPSCTSNIGSFAADFKSVSPQTGGVQVTKTFSSTSATVDARAYLNVRSASSNATLFTFRTSAGGVMWHAYLDYLTGRIGIRSDAGAAATYPGCNLPLPTAYPWSHYHSVEAKTVVAPSGNSTIQIWVDGQPETLAGPDGVCNTTDDTNAQPAFVGNTNAGKVILGDTAANRTFDIWADDAAINNSYIGSAWGSLRGQLTDAATRAPIAGATVAVAYTTSKGATPPPATTDANGNYTISNIIANQDLNLTISAASYATQTPTVSMPFDGNVTYNSQLALMQGTVSGTATDAVTGTPLSGVTVTGPENVSTTTNGAGRYSLATASGQITLTASMPGYQDSTVTANVPPAGTSMVNFSLTPSPGTISGTVTRLDGVTPVSGATVGMAGGPSTTSDAAGNYTLTGVPAEVSQTLTAASAGYRARSATISLPPGGTATQNYLLTKVLFGDDFESAGFASWSTKVNMAICTNSVGGCPHQGTYGAEGSASGTTAAYAAKTLGTPVSEIYLRAYVYIRSQGSNNASILQVVNGSGVPIAHVFVNAAHQLGIRDDYAVTTTQSTTAVSLGTWHVVEFHVKVNGTASSTNVYLDGSAIPALSSTSASLGTNNVAAVWLGENQANRTYDLLYDDVVAADGYIGP